MAVTQKGANYPFRDQLEDGPVKKVLDVINSRVQAILNQGNFGPNGTIEPPSAPTSISVVYSGGIYTVSIMDGNAEAGKVYRLQRSTNASFPSSSIIEEEITPMTSPSNALAATWQKSLPNTQFYFRVAAKYSASEVSPWVYFGSAASPTLVQGAA